MVKDQVDPFFLGKLLDHVAEVRGLSVIDDEVGPQLLDPLHFARVGGDDQLAVGGQSLAQLNAGRVHAAAAAMQDGGLAVLELADHKDVEKGRDVGLAHAGGFLEAHAVRDTHQVIGIGHGIFRIAAAADQRHDPLAFFPPADAGADSLDDP